VGEKNVLNGSYLHLDSFHSDWPPVQMSCEITLLLRVHEGTA
jgi:hypothetical protein